MVCVPSAGYDPISVPKRRKENGVNKLPVLIPNEEYKDRVRRLQQAMAAEDLDAVLCYANSSVYQNVRYLCNYWPMFETGGILVPRK